MIFCVITIIGCQVFVWRRLKDTSETLGLLGTCNDDKGRISSMGRLVSRLIISFLLAYSLAFYLEFRQMLTMVGVRFDYIIFEENLEGPPSFNDVNLLLFRLKYVLIIAYSTINPVIMFQGSSLLRDGLPRFWRWEYVTYVD